MASTDMEKAEVLNEFFAWEDHGADPPGRDVSTHEEVRQPAQLHQGQIVPDQSGGLL